MMNKNCRLESWLKSHCSDESPDKKKGFSKDIRDIVPAEELWIGDNKRLAPTTNRWYTQRKPRKMAGVPGKNSIKCDAYGRGHTCNMFCSQ